MQNAETVLGVLRERGRRGLPVDEIYRQMFNPQMYLLAYGRIYANHGAMTPGVTQETADGMSLRTIDCIIDAMRHERYRFSPTRRVHIPKKNGKTRPLGLPTWPDKLVGEVVRLLLEAYYEPQFSGTSHGFRPDRGCHTALNEIGHWHGTTWFIEGDISDCFGSFDHQVMLKILGEKIHDNRFLRLIHKMLTAGYLQDWTYGATLSGAPQGGVASPILSNIYLHKLDQFVENVLIPESTRGTTRARNREYIRLRDARKRARERGDRVQAKALLKQLHSLPSGDPQDPRFRRLRYVRYADDHILGFTGPKTEAEKIKQRIATFLRDELKLELSQEKTVITHARTRAAKFLGYEIIVQHGDSRLNGKQRTANGKIGLRVPKTVIKTQCAPYLKRGEPARRPEMISRDDHTIVAAYGARYRGVVQYYLLAGDVWRLGRLNWVMVTSMLKTLAAKHRSSVQKIADKHKSKIETPHGTRRCFEARVDRNGREPLVARFGGIPLRQQRRTVLNDRDPRSAPHPPKELISRLLKGKCEICGHNKAIQVHQIRKLADLKPSGPPWMEHMAKIRRKTLVVCGPCHLNIHPETTSNPRKRSLESRLR